MAAFGIVVRGKRRDGYYPVYVRVSHGSGTVAYMKTAFVVSDKGLRKVYTKAGKEKVEVSDVKVVRECMNEIAGYVRRLNDIDSDGMTIQEIVRFLGSTDGEADLSFSEFAEEYVSDMRNAGRDKPAMNYVMAVKRLHEHIGKDNILFKDITVSVITGWIESMSSSARKRNMYPNCVKSIFGAAISKYNDEDRDIIRIRKNPFNRVKIPKSKLSEKRGVSPSIVRKFLNIPVRETVYGDLTKAVIARDVCKVVFCLAGINTADLYDLSHDSLRDGVLRYCRKKTRDKSDSNAYTEITVPEEIKPIMDKYRGKKKLFIFSERYATPSDFASNVSRGCKKVCEAAGITENLTPYSFRHSWATIALNKCGASMDDVAFGLNHASAHKITSTYIKPDYTRIDRINEKVIHRTFGRWCVRKRLRAVAGRRKGSKRVK